MLLCKQIIFMKSKKSNLTKYNARPKIFLTMIGNNGTKRYMKQKVQPRNRFDKIQN